MIRKNFLHRKLFMATYRCMCRCISTWRIVSCLTAPPRNILTYLLMFVCLYVYFDVLHSLHVVCRLVYLTHFHFCTHIHAVVIICICHIFIKETACLLLVPRARTATGQRSFYFLSQRTSHMEPSATRTTVTGPVGERLQAGSEDAPVLDRPAPLRRFHDSGAGYKYPDLLTYLLNSRSSTFTHVPAGSTLHEFYTL